MKFQESKEIFEWHVELGHPFDVIMQATGKAMGLKLTSVFNHCKYFALGNAKKNGASNLDVERSKVKGERLLIDINSPSTVSTSSKKHWLLALEDGTNQSWSYFWKENLEQKDVIMAVIKD